MIKTVTIILPTHNGGGTIEDSIKSVQNQSFQDWELFVIIDGSTDATLERVLKIAQQDNRIIVINNEQNQGIQKTLNTGLQKSTGKYIARIDDDDVWVDTQKLQKQVDFLERHHDYVLVGTGIVLVNESGKEITRYLLPQKDFEIRNKILEQNCFAHPTVVFRKDVLEKIGNYSEQKKHKHIEDYELWLRMGLVGKFANLPYYSLRYQVSEKSISGKNKLVQLRKNMLLSWIFRKKYPNFWKNFFIAIVRYALYFLFGSVLSKSPKIRGKITALYKKLF